MMKCFSKIRVLCICILSCSLACVFDNDMVFAETVVKFRMYSLPSKNLRLRKVGTEAAAKITVKAFKVKEMGRLSGAAKSSTGTPITIATSDQQRIAASDEVILRVSDPGDQSVVSDAEVEYIIDDAKVEYFKDDETGEFRTSLVFEFKIDNQIVQQISGLVIIRDSIVLLDIIVPDPIVPTVQFPGSLIPTPPTCIPVHTPAVSTSPTCVPTGPACVPTMPSCVPKCNPQPRHRCPIIERLRARLGASRKLGGVFVATGLGNTTELQSKEWQSAIQDVLEKAGDFCRWTNRDNTITVTARILDVKGDIATFEMPEGRLTQTSLEKLSFPNRELIAKMLSLSE